MNRALALVLLVALPAGGCMMKTHTAPSMNPEPARADYTVLGKTNHEECGSYIFGIDWGHLFANQKARSVGYPAWRTREASRALYHALDKMPEATHLMAERSHTSMSGLLLFGAPFFGERCVSVEARGIQIGDRPLSTQIHIGGSAEEEE